MIERENNAQPKTYHFGSSSFAAIELPQNCPTSLLKAHIVLTFAHGDTDTTADINELIASAKDICRETGAERLMIVTEHTSFYLDREGRLL